MNRTRFDPIYDIRNSREQQIALKKSTAEKILARSQKILETRRRQIQHFIVGAKREIEQSYKRILIKPINIALLNRLRSREAWLKERESELMLELKKMEKEVEGKKKEFQKLQSLHQKSLRNLEKIAFLIAREEQEIAKQREAEEEKVLEEFTPRKRRFGL